MTTPALTYSGFLTGDPLIPSWETTRSAQTSRPALARALAFYEIGNTTMTSVDDLYGGYLTWRW